ncbi:MAG: chorismate mutase [Halanaerobium sp.]|nr:chorismate mutase [Halanaerobium sp.]
MFLIGIRGATTVEANTQAAILARTEELLQAMMVENNLVEDDLVSIIFSLTDDLNAVYPAAAAREMGLLNTPLFCTREIPVPGSLASCVRILIHANSSLQKDEVEHIYLHGAKQLRPDLSRG